MLRRQIRGPRLLFLAIVLLGLPVHGMDWNPPAQRLAQQIAAGTGRAAIAIDFSNLSSLTNADVDAITTAIRNQLAAAGVRVVSQDPAAALVRITFSENLQNYVWVARTQQGTAPAIVSMIAVARVEAPVMAHAPAGVLIRKIQLWSQADPILDTAVIDSSPPQIVVLDPQRVTAYLFQNSSWEQQQSFPLVHAHPWPRDLRGRLVLRKDHLFDAYLPGTFCSTSVSAPATLSCRESDDPWPVGNDLVNLNAFFSPNRNFFTGALSPGIAKQVTVSAFYTAAPILREHYVLWVLSGGDGQVHEADGVNEQTLGRLNWGSDIAAVKTSCGSGTQILATSNTGSTAGDTVRAFEIVDRDPVPVSQPVELNGPVTALWSETSGTSAVVVSRNLQTGKYEAFRLAITCGQ